jgi:hypothetical protein
VLSHLKHAEAKQKTAKAINLCGCCIQMATPAGFEPATF